MDQVSRPLQIVLVVVLGFAGLWFMALRPKPGGRGGSAPAPAPAVQAPAPKKSAIPGGLGSAVDKARAAKLQGDAAAAARPGQVDAKADPQAQNTPATPVQAPPAKPPVSAAKPSSPQVATGSVALVSAGSAAFGLVRTGLDDTAGAKGLSSAAGEGRPGFATPGKIRAALAQRHVVVLLFFSADSADDRAVRNDLGAVNRHGGRVDVWAVSVRGLPRFKNVMQGVQVLQSPTVVVLSRSNPYVFPGFTDHAEIDQAAAVALRSKRA